MRFKARTTREERERSHAKKRREIREPAVRADEPAGTGHEAGLQFEIPSGNGMRVDHVEAGISGHLVVHVLVHTKARAQERHRRLRRHCAQQLRYTFAIRERVGKGLAEIELREDVFRWQSAGTLSWREWF